MTSSAQLLLTTAILAEVDEGACLKDKSLPQKTDARWSAADSMVALVLPDNQRTDRYPNSILDFIFVAGPAQQWQAKSWGVVRPEDFPDSDETSDHRPVAAVVELPSG